MMSAPAITISETTDMKTKIADPDIAALKTNCGCENTQAALAAFTRQSQMSKI
jgi:hypothetical protein